MFLNFKRRRPIALHSIAQAVQGTDSGISTPRKNELLRTTCADELVINHVWRQAHQRQIFALLPKDFVSSGKWDQMGEALHRDHVAITHQACNRFAKSGNFRHWNRGIEITRTASSFRNVNDTRMALCPGATRQYRGNSKEGLLLIG